MKQLSLPLNKKQAAILSAVVGSLGWMIYTQTTHKMRTSDRKAKKQFKKAGINLHTETVLIDGQPLHYARTGNPTLPVLLFIHGSPKSWDYFQAFLKDDQLLERFCIVSIDRPGFGYSGFGQAKRIPEQARTVAKLIDKIASERPVYIVGHSFGAPVASAIAVLRPYLVKSLVLVAGALDPQSEKPSKMGRLLMLPPFSYLLPGALRPSNKELYFLKKDLEEIQPKYSQINCPVFLVHAEDDEIVNVEQSSWAGKHFTNAQEVKLLSFPKGGHFLPTKKFDQFRQLLLQVLQPAQPML